MKNYLQQRNGNMDMFDDLFGDIFAPYRVDKAFKEMRTDIKEDEKGYEFSIDMPGYDKKDIKLELNDGYITVSAKREELEEKKFVKRERTCSCQRSFYVGDKVTEEDVKAKLENGTLKLFVPKIEVKEIPKKQITID